VRYTSIPRKGGILIVLLADYMGCRDSRRDVKEKRFQGQKLLQRSDTP